MKECDTHKLANKGFVIGKPLNSGSFACVYTATFNGEPAAVKVIDLEKTSEDYRLKFLPRELYTMKKFKHPHLIKILDIFSIGNYVMVFMELADGGDFLDLLADVRALPEDKAKYYFEQFGDALSYMHDRMYAHRDIKCENILLNKNRTQAKLTDFGFTRSCAERCTGNRVLSETFCGSAAYVAPEVLQGTLYNPLISDVWSMGVVLYVLTQNKLPFDEKDNRILLQRQLDKEYSYYKKVSDVMKDLIQKLLDPNPATRLNMAEVLAHEWVGLQQFNSTSTLSCKSTTDD